MSWQQTATRQRSWLLWLIVSIGIVGTAAFLEFQPPRTIAVPLLGIRLPQMCSMSRMFGIDCPGCGLTRSFVLAADGRLAVAFAIHPVGTIAFILLVVQIPLRLWQGWHAMSRRSELRTGAVEAIIAAMLVGAAFLWWAAKMTGVVGAT